MFHDLSPGKHLLLDNASIADSYRLHRRVHSPRLDPVTPILTPQRPWEGDSVTPLNVACEGGRWRMCWSGNSDLSSLRGRRLMLKMALHHAEIYSLTL